jgi:hypothetical protein
MMPVATPHELLMALLPDLFPWQSKITTDFQTLLCILKSKPQVALKAQTEEKKEEYQDSLSLVRVEHRDLVPIFSVQVL